MADITRHGSLTEKFLNKHLNKKGVNKITNKLDDLSGTTKGFEGLGAAGFGFAALAGIGVPIRLNQGEGLGEAVGKEILEDMKYTMAPELFVAEMGKIATDVYPKLNRAMEAKRSFNMNYNFLGGSNEYMDTQANYTSRAQGMQAMKLNRMQMASLGGEARKHHKVY
jgi:hypothetical protein